MPKIEVIEERMNNLIKQNSKEHEEILETIKVINEKLDQTFITKEQFDPVKRIVYGLVAIILTTVAGAIINSVLTH